MGTRGPRCQNAQTLFVAGVSKNALAEATAQLNTDGRYRVLYEPFNEWYYPRLWALRYPSYLPISNKREDLAAVFDRIITGRVGRPEIVRAVDNVGMTARAQKFLIRECRCNLWLGYLRAHYPGMPIIFMWRHPCASIASRLLLEWSPQLKRQLRSKDIISEHLQPFMHELTQAKEPLDQHAFMWAIHHYVPLRQFAKGDIHLAFYESLVTNASSASRLWEYSGQAPVQRDVNARRRSEQVSVLDTWRRQLSGHQVRRIMDILRVFGLDKVYSEDTFPDERAAHGMLRSA